MINAKVKFTCDIIDPACGDHPDLLIAAKGTEGTVIRKFDKFKDYEYVVECTDSTGRPNQSVWCNRHEFEEV